MKRRKKQKVLVLLIFLTLISSPQTLFAEKITKETNIFYNNTKTITDPETPQKPEYMISVPAELVFDKEHTRIDASVSMNDLQGNHYKGEKKSKVSVASKNGYLLKEEDSPFTIRYTMVKYDNSGKGSILTNTSHEIGILDKNHSLVEVKAIIGSTSIADKNVGFYSDILTYNVEKIE